MELLLTVICGVITLISLVLFFVWNRLRYWKLRQIPHDEPLMFLGNMRPNTHQSTPMNQLYKKYKGTGPFCGLYFFMTPAVLTLDLDLVKKVLIKDFTNFSDRGFFSNQVDDPLSAHLLTLDGKGWRLLRNKLSPTFTSKQMKFMFPSVVEVGHRFVKTLSEIIGEQNSELIEIKDLNARFTTDVIGSCAFGLECNSLTDPNAEFRKYGRLIFEEQNHHALILGFMQSSPKLARLLRMRMTRRDVEKFFMEAVRGTVEYREKNNIRKNDFMSLLIDLKNNKPIYSEDGKQVDTSGLTMEELAAQAFLFWVAGFETSSSTMTYAIYELARNTDIQDKLRQSINEVLEKHDGELTYESLKEMHYFDQVFDETLRFYPIVPFLQRIAASDYSSTSDPKYKIEKGSLIFIPVEAIHYDPEIYPNPCTFDPERFSSEEKAKRDTVAYLPFGEGPRNCVGLRFGKMQAIIGLVSLIRNFKFSWCEETPTKLQYDPAQILLATRHGIHLKVEKV
ncbi:cytochrome P450 6a8-like [Episyrphus balteatus]|uniref:cytochrome P450 6a8-like n=1 Tax=Episyrphus balteatus TaxID=286459 RepID=UPI002484EA9F|nr:cytochrome P450 6a8-like [Episyrphus balteatus]